MCMGKILSAQQQLLYKGEGRKLEGDIYVIRKEEEEEREERDSSHCVKVKAVYIYGGRHRENIVERKKQKKKKKTGRKGIQYFIGINDMAAYQ